jgi:hypothetical protein
MVKMAPALELLAPSRRKASNTDRMVNPASGIRSVARRITRLCALTTPRLDCTLINSLYPAADEAHWHDENQ